jgi:hypothetical protein
MPIPARKAKRAFTDTIVPVAANDNQIARQKTAPAVSMPMIEAFEPAKVRNSANDNLSLTLQRTTTDVAA